LFYKHKLNAGEQQRTAENRFTKAGRNFEGIAKNPEILMDQRDLAVPSKTGGDVSRRNDSPTRRVKSGKIWGIGSVDVHP
jgi:hypothetical protein